MADLGMCSREKYWSEINDQERIVRLREVVNRLMRQVDELRRTNERLLSHCHTEDGRPAILLGDLPIGGEGKPIDRTDETYF